MPKKIILTTEQWRQISEELVNVAAQAKGDSLAYFTQAANDTNTKNDIQKASSVGDVNLTISGPNSNDSQPQQVVNVAAGDSVQNAINTQANDTIIRNGGSVKITGDGLSEMKAFSKKTIDEIRYRNLQKKGRMVLKKDFEKE